MTVLHHLKMGSVQSYGAVTHNVRRSKVPLTEMVTVRVNKALRLEDIEVAFKFWYLAVKFSYLGSENRQNSLNH